MQQYLDLLQDILDNGDWQQNRTGIRCKSIPGACLKYDLSNGFPAVTTKKLAWNAVRGELIGFLRGYTNAADFRNLNCKIWDANANDPGLPGSPNAWLSSPYRKGEDDLGVVYGAQWTNWQGYKEVESDSDAYADAVSKGYTTIGISTEKSTETKTVVIMRKGVNQVENVLRSLIFNPTDRRMIISGWNPPKFDEMALPPCFTGDTLVTTPGKHVPISEIKEGDFVISAEGFKRKVNKVWITPYKGTFISLKVRYNNRPIKCTPNHPFLVKDKGWVEAKDLKKGDFLCIPKPKDGENYSFNYEVNHGSSGVMLAKSYTLTDEDYFFLGYFMGDGWVVNNTHRVCVSIAHKDVEAVLPRLRNSIKLSHSPKSGVKVSKFETFSQKWTPVLRQFGHLAHNKTIPEWVFSSSKEAKTKFLEGYFAADGYNIKNKFLNATTVSTNLAYGLQRLGASFDKVNAVRFQVRPKSTYIEGRLVNQRDTYTCIMSKPGEGYPIPHDDDYVCTPITEVFSFEDEADVYNLDVDTDHTYQVSNLATHNCHATYQFLANVEKNELSLCMYQRSCDEFLGVPFNIASSSLFLVIMARLSGFKPKQFTHFMADSHIYENHVEQVKEQISRTPKALPKLVISDRIPNYTDLRAKGEKVPFEPEWLTKIEPSDFELVDYDPWPAIKAPMAV